MNTSFRESEVLELKKSTSELKEAVVSIVSILNKHQRGELYFGIKNDGTVVGQDVTENTIREISRTIGDNIEPKIYPKIEKVNIDGRDCVMVSFSGEKTPYFAFGRSYIRVGDEDRQLSVTEMEKFFLEKNTEKMQWDNQPADCSIKDIGIKTVKTFVKKANQAGRISFKFKNIKTTLKKTRYLKGGKLLRAAQVLFSKKNPLKVQAAVFAGTERLTFIDIQQFENENLFELLETSLDYVKKHINWGVKFGRLEREEIPEIPVDALREAIINSLCHRDYYTPDANKIAVYKNRVEIFNPGQFPAGLKPEDFIKKDEQSILRNPLIAEGFYLTKDIEKWGSGLKRIFDECNEKKVKFEFQLLKTGFQVTFYRKQEYTQTKEQLAKNYTKTRGKTKLKEKKLTELILSKNYPKTIQKILLALTKKPQATILELSKITGLSEIGVKYNLKKLKKQKTLKRIGGKKGGHWEVTVHG